MPRSPSLWTGRIRTPLASPLLLLILPLLAGLSRGVHASDLFNPFLDAGSPAILRTLPSPGPEELPSDVRIRRLVFESIVVEELTNEVFAVIASPVQPGPHPGLLLLHGGQGRAPEAEAILWAQRGYVALALDLPGIADPIHTTDSAGAWRYRPYNAMVWTVTPTPATSVLYDATAAALQGFELLRTQPDVDREHIGILGWSWGGYLTTQLSGLLGDRVAAAFSHYGSGFYEDTWFGVFLGWMQPADRSLWLDTFDAGRRAPSITAPFFMAAAANDTYFRPPAIERTLAAIPGETGLVYAPNAHHQLPVPGGTNLRSGDFLAETWFARHLQGSSSAFPSIEWESTARPGAVAFRVTGPRPPLAASLWYSRPDPLGSWPDRRWIEVPANARGGGRYEVLLPPDAQTTGAAWFILASDDRPVSASTRMRITGTDLPATYYLREDFSGPAAGGAVPGWSGQTQIHAEPTPAGFNQAMSVADSTQSPGAWLSLSTIQSAESGIRLSLRIRPAPGIAPWNSECLLLGTPNPRPATPNAGFGFRLTRESLVLLKSGTNLSPLGTFALPVPVRDDSWSVIHLEWKPGGQIDFSVNGATIATITNDLQTGAVLFQTLTISNPGLQQAGGLLYDDLVVESIPPPVTTPVPRWLAVGVPEYSDASNRTLVTHQFIGSPGVTYRIEYAPSPDSSSWRLLGDHQAGGSGQLLVPIEETGNTLAGWSTAAFFRITWSNPPAGQTPPR